MVKKENDTVPPQNVVSPIWAKRTTSSSLDSYPPLVWLHWRVCLLFHRDLIRLQMQLRREDHLRDRRWEGDMRPRLRLQGLVRLMLLCRGREDLDRRRECLLHQLGLINLDVKS